MVFWLSIVVSIVMSVRVKNVVILFVCVVIVDVFFVEFEVGVMFGVVCYVSVKLKFLLLVGGWI